MEPAITVALYWVLFAGTHVGLTTRRVREFLVSRLGALGFSLLFSGIAAATFTLFIHTYATVRFDGAAGLDLGRFSVFRYGAIATMVAGIVLSVGSLWRLPASTLALVDPRSFSPRGLERVTRHPFFIGVALLGIAHALLATRLVGTVTFGGLALLSIVGALHQDTKLRAHLGAKYAAYLDVTSFVPFAAIVAGRQRIVWGEVPWTGLAVGLAIAFALRSVHASIFAHGGAWVIGAVLGGAAMATVQALGHRRRESAEAAALARSAPR